MSDTQQSYEKHAHQPTAAGVAGIFTLLAIVLIVGAWFFGWRTRDAGILSLALAVVMLVSISRMYIVRLQDRIIMLEMKLRGAELLTPDQEAQLAKLSRRQIIALRFASDEELPALLERAAREDMTADQIKRAIKTWRPDLYRT